MKEFFSFALKLELTEPISDINPKTLLKALHLADSKNMKLEMKVKMKVKEFFSFALKLELIELITGIKSKA